MQAVHSTTALNTSFLTKGTYSMLNVAGKGVLGGLKERIKVEVVRLES